MSTTSYNQVGQHKELSDIVELLVRDETPFTSMIGSGRVINTLFNWVEEDLNSVDPDNAAVEGADVTDYTDQNATERQNYTQIFRRSIMASGTSQAVDQAGQLEKLRDQVMKRAKEVKRDAEAAFLSGQVAAAGNGTTARKTASFQAQVAPENIVDKAGAAVTEADLEEILLSIYEQGGRPKTVMAHPRVRTALVKVLTDNSGRLSDRGLDPTINAMVDTYISNVGTVKLVNNYLAPYDSGTGTGDIFIFDDEMWSVEYLRPYKVEDLAKTGDADKRMLVMEAGLKNANYRSAGIIQNVLV